MIADNHQHCIPRPERRGVSRANIIEAAKEAVPTIQLADLLCGPAKMRRSGQTWVARCPLPGHEDRMPSFTVYPNTNSFFCFGCLRGGDVIELARYAWHYSKQDAPIAAADLLREFGHEMPSRPPAWFRKQERQRRTRAAIEEVKVRSLQRRLFRMKDFSRLITTVEDAEERRLEAEHVWGECGSLARLMVWRARGEGGIR